MKYLATAVSVLLLHYCGALAQDVKNVAIIGAGSGGSSTAYYLGQFAKAAGVPLNLTVFERSGYIGGRSTTVNVFDDPSQPVELGASIFVAVNKNLVDACDTFNLTVVKDLSRRTTRGVETLGVWNGEEFVVRTEFGDSTWMNWWSRAKLLWRYGWAPISTRSLMKDTIGRFLKMYEYPLFPWSSLTQAMLDVGLLPMTSHTGKQVLDQHGIGKLFAEEIVQASTRVNYAQNLDKLHGLETMVCMAAEGAMAVKGGNWQIFDGMIKHSNAFVRLNTAVTGLDRHGDGTYTVHFKEFTSEGDFDSMASEQHFDNVVLAAPFQFADVNIQPQLGKEPDRIPYVTLHVTLFSSPSRLSPIPFGLDKSEAVPDVILTTLQPETDDTSSSHDWLKPDHFFSISTLQTVSNPSVSPASNEYVYKIFSPERVSDNFINLILEGTTKPSAYNAHGEHVSWVYRKAWKSYPILHPRVTFEDVQLDDKLWYTSGIESFISTMETSSLMGKNVARLIVDEWQQGLGGEEKKYHGMADDEKVSEAKVLEQEL